MTIRTKVVLAASVLSMVMGANAFAQNTAPVSSTTPATTTDTAKSTTGSTDVAKDAKGKPTVGTSKSDMKHVKKGAVVKKDDVKKDTTATTPAAQ